MHQEVCPQEGTFHVNFAPRFPQFFPLLSARVLRNETKYMSPVKMLHCTLKNSFKDITSSSLHLLKIAADAIMEVPRRFSPWYNSIMCQLSLSAINLHWSGTGD